jgi:hypothetical protein
VLPNFVRQFAAGGAEVLINISNDGWFGQSAARYQHLEMVRMRAAENRRWILRSTNDGITATIDSAGRLRGTLPLYTEATSYTGFTYISERTPLHAIRELVRGAVRDGPQRFARRRGRFDRSWLSPSVCSGSGVSRSDSFVARCLPRTR